MHQDTSGSLVERGAGSGEYLLSEEHLARSAIGIAERVDRPDRAALARRAQGRVEFAKSLRGLAEHDDAAARVALENACRLVPELAAMQEYVSRRMLKIGVTPEEKHRIIETAARLWPDPRCDTALFLRWQAAGRAFRRRQPGTALQLLAGTPLPAVPALLVRNRSRWARLARRRAQALRHRGEESRELEPAVR